ncbi:hypothetical protein N7504_006351 [Penicillium tannophilum]|nr:hypothetical protein N7504_006351 [Penicillium tannophilum]
MDLHRLIPMSLGIGGAPGYEECTTEYKASGLLDGDCFPDGIYDSYESHKVSREKGTCEWILDRAWFLEWSLFEPLDGLAKILWINGLVGFGKSVLCARIFDHLSSLLDAPVAHFFFISDLERNNPFVVNVTHGEAMRILRSILKAIPGCIFLLDGLDECNLPNEGRRIGADDLVLGFMRALRLAITNLSTRLMILSRDEPEIRTYLSDYLDEALVFEYSITA